MIGSKAAARKPDSDVLVEYFFPRGTCMPMAIFQASAFNHPLVAQQQRGNEDSFVRQSVAIAIIILPLGASIGTWRMRFCSDRACIRALADLQAPQAVNASQ